jgi:MFS transporter, DHA1 family, multidrug resistance protein
VVNNNFSSRQLFLYSAISYFVIAFSGASMDIYVPGLVHMAHDLQVSRYLVALTIAGFASGLALGQLVAGALADSWGRKKILLLSLSTQLILIVLIVIFQNVYLKIVMRFLQGLMVALMSVGGRAMLLDLFSGDELQKKLNSMTIFWALGPLCAPLLGGYLVAHFGWLACFYFLWGYVLLAFILVLFFCDETLEQTKSFQVKDLLLSFRQLLLDLQFVLCSMIAGVMASFIYFFNVAAPFIVHAHLHSSLSGPIITGYCSMLMGVGWIVGNLFSRILNIDVKLKVRLCCIIAVACALSMLLIAYFTAFSFLLLVIPSVLLLLCMAVCFSDFITLGLANKRHMGGGANACMFSIIWLFCTVLASCGSLVSADHLTSLATGYTFILLFLSVLIIIYNCRYKFSIEQ